VVVHREDDVTSSVSIYMLGDRAVKFIMEERDACEFSLVLGGYYRLLTGEIVESSLSLLRTHCDQFLNCREHA